MDGKQVAIRAGVVVGGVAILAIVLPVVYFAFLSALGLLGIAVTRRDRYRLADPEIDPYMVMGEKELNDHSRDLQERAGYFIIKGELVVPKAVDKVTQWEV